MPGVSGLAGLTARWEARRWHYRRSLASRVAVLTALAVGLSLALLALIAYAVVSMQLQRSLDASLQTRAEKAVQGGALQRLAANDQSVPSWVLGAADVRIIFIDALGGISSADRGPVLVLGQPELDVARGQSDLSIRTIVADSTHYRVVTVPAENGQALVLAQSLEPQLRTLHRLAALLFGFAGVGVVIAALAGWAVARNGLRPVRRLSRSVEEKAETEELTPLRVEGDDEVARLATAFNRLLAGLSASRDRQRQLVADAGHELRTPLTSLRTNLDLLTQADVAGGLPPGARAELLDDVRGQLEELTTLIGDLVELSRDEPLTLVEEDVDLADVVEAALVRVRRRAPGLTFRSDLSPTPVVGDAAALERAVTNMLDNAAKWSPAAGIVDVTLHDGALCVDDQGPGISEADLPHVFERFYRSQESRSMPGSGLGLSIVRQVAERHGGSVSAGRSPALGGARLMMLLPTVRSDTDPASPRTKTAALARRAPR